MALQSNSDRQPAPAFSQEQLNGVIALYSEGRLQEAMSAVQGLISKNSNAPVLHNLTGAIHVGLGQLDHAVESFLRALEIKPDYAEAHNNLGNALKDRGKHAEALASYHRALEIKPDYAEAHYNLGVALSALGKHKEAVAAYHEALEIKPDIAEAHSNLGVALSELGQPEEAVASYYRALEMKPDIADAHYNLGIALKVLGKHEEAIASYHRALEIKPNIAEAHYNLGIALKELGKHEEALASYYRALEIKPDYAEAHNNLANALKNLGKYEEALASHHRALKINPDYPNYHCNLAYTLLVNGDFEAGWKEHEWRLQIEEPENSRRSFAQPLWLGKETLKGRTILLHGEQGFGDTIQFSRFAKMVAGRGARVILEVPRPLLELMGTLDGVARVVDKGAVLPNFDYYCPLMSLPLAFNIDSESVPASTPYIFSDSARVATWQKKLGARTKPRVGLVWSGQLAHQNDRNRSIALARMLPLLARDVEWISLHKEIRKSDADFLSSRKDILHFGDELKDFADTAALIELMDLVISVDTSVAHLAGAMAKPVWILLPIDPDWRWLLNREDSPWYPTATLFRQPRIGDWTSVIARVHNELSTFIEGGEMGPY
ncbi:MAG: tetratricopeptide repeat protein [Alphaproteobacteria bacterium]|nr:tetratricopeptide repeat protein [Alphaproteobacteria bacterium]